MKRGSFLQNSTSFLYFYIMIRRKLYPVDKNAQFISLHNKFKIMLYA